MNQVLCRTAGRVALTLAVAGVVGSVTLPVVPALAGTPRHRGAANVGLHRPGDAGTGGGHGSTGPVRTQIGTAVKFVREADGSVRQVR